MGFSFCVALVSSSSFRDAPQGAGPESMFPRGHGFRARRFAAPRNDGKLAFTRHFLRPLPEHIPPRLLVERLLHELADRKTRLHLRPRAHVRVPALDVRVVIE